MTKHGKNAQKCVGKVSIQIQQKPLLKDGEGEQCIIKLPKLMERSIDEDDDGYDKDIVNSGIYRTSGAIKFSLNYSALCSSITSSCWGMLNMTMNPCMNPHGTRPNCHTKSFQDFREI